MVKMKYNSGTDKWLPPKKRHRGVCINSAKPPPPPPKSKKGDDEKVGNRFPTNSNNNTSTTTTTTTTASNGTVDNNNNNNNNPGKSEPLRYTTDVIQQLLDRNAEILQSWIRVKERGGVAMSGAPDELQKNLSGLAAAALHDGADDFFPLRPGNVEVGGKNIVEPQKKFHSTKKVVVEPNARRAGVSALEIKILTELHVSQFASGVQLRDAISVCLQSLLRVNNGNLSNIQRHVRDILLRIISTDLTIPRTFQLADSIISTLLFDLRKGQLSLNKYRRHLSALSGKEGGNGENNNYQEQQQQQQQQRNYNNNNNNNRNNVSLLPSGRSVIGPSGVETGSHNLNNDNSVNQFIMQQQRLQAQVRYVQQLQMQQQQMQQQSANNMSGNGMRRPVGRPPKNNAQQLTPERQQRILLLLQQQQQHNLQARSYNLQAMRQAQHQMAMGDFGDVPQDPNGARTKWPFIMNMGGGNQGLQVKVWLPDSLVDKLAKRKS